jgi:hypothetical protein
MGEVKTKVIKIAAKKDLYAEKVMEFAQQGDMEQCHESRVSGKMSM